MIDPEDRPDILNLSFSAFTEDDEPPPAISGVLRRLTDDGVVAVASAGNDGSCRAAFPAALSYVVAVGALSPLGQAFFSNYGPWVDACAPGVDVVSRYFTDDGKTKDSDGDLFAGWASWSGTSFAAPAVVGAIVARSSAVPAASPARERLASAVKAVVREPSLMRYPGLGTIVNVT